jgi:hypothetical protein
MTLLRNIQVCGVLMLALASLHLAFPGRFRWTEEFRHVSLLSRQMFYVHTGFVGLIVFLNGLLYTLLAPDLVVPSRLSAAILGCAALFWTARLLVQFFVYSPTLWRGKAFETRIHVGAVLLWTYFSATSWAALISALR